MSDPTALAPFFFLTLPAHDATDYLKTIAGFALTRKSGTDSDPFFRSRAGSRLGILLERGNRLGGCNARMGTPTAYIFPERYDRLSVIKRPQTVLSGRGVTAAPVATGMGGSIPGYAQTTRVNEPGRLLWLKATLQC